jgi:adenylylsulfate kinase
LKAEKNNLFTTYDKILSKEEKETAINQRGMSFWLTGLSGSGKTTIGAFLEKKLFEQNIIVALLDGDNIRSGINDNLSFSDDDRIENIRRIAEVSKLFNMNGIVTINCFVSPFQSSRDQAKEIIGADSFFDIFIDTSIDECEKRDVKGLYKKARAGKIKDFTGISSPFEEPKNPSLKISTFNKTIEECGDELFNFVYPKIKFAK